MNWKPDSTAYRCFLQVHLNITCQRTLTAPSNASNLSISSANSRSMQLHLTKTQRKRVSRIGGVNGWRCSNLSNLKCWCSLWTSHACIKHSETSFLLWNTPTSACSVTTRTQGQSIELLTVIC